MKALVWPVATYGCESWTLRKNEETRLVMIFYTSLKTRKKSRYLCNSMIADTEAARRHAQQDLVVHRIERCTEI